MKKILFLFVLLLNFSNSHACLNYYYSIDHEGHFHDAEGLKTHFNINFNPRTLEAEIKKNADKLKTTKDYKWLSNYAVLLLKAGRTKEALDLLEQLSLKHLDEYQIAANLGTAYELSGNVEKALEYIKRGVELNPNAHDGSEWVHVKLLEAKLKLQSDPNYLTKNTVLNLSANQKKDLKVRQQLMIQIRERFPFCKGPDPIMASLLIDLGDCYAQTTSIEYAKALYEIALNYYGAPAKVADPKIKEMKELLRQYSNLKVNQWKLNDQNLYEGLDGEHNRISGIKYTTLLDDNNPSKYTINWSGIQLNTDSLLAYAQIERVVPPPVKADSVEVKSSAAPRATQGTTKVSLTLWIYLLIGGFAVLGIAIIAYIRKRN